MRKRSAMQTKTKYFNEGKERFKLVVKYGCRMLGNQEPYFTITADCYRIDKDNGLVDDSGGCLHDLIAEQLPELKPLIPFHLWGQVKKEPMHYIANSIHFYLCAINECYLFKDRKEEQTQEEQEKNLLYFKSNVLLGMFEDDDWESLLFLIENHPHYDKETNGIRAAYYKPKWKIEWVKSELKKWLIDRKEKLAAKMEGVMTEFNVKAIPLSVTKKPCADGKGNPHPSGSTYDFYMPLAIDNTPFNKQHIECKN